MVRCQRNPDNIPKAKAFWAAQKAAWVARRHPLRPALASWYNDGGATASGFHAYYGFASLIYGFGTRIKFCYHGRCVTGVDDDHGPYIAGRTFDLNQNIAGALGFSGVGTVYYRVL